MTKKITGFTLVEIIIAVAVAFILETLAVASYRIYIVRARESNAQQTLLQNAQTLERWHAQTGTYANAAVETAVTDSGSNVYQIVTTTAADTFTMIATPICSSSQKNEGCFTINQNSQVTESACSCAS